MELLQLRYFCVVAKYQSQLFLEFCKEYFHVNG